MLRAFALLLSCAALVACGHREPSRPSKAPALAMAMPGLRPQAVAIGGTGPIIAGRVEGENSMITGDAAGSSDWFVLALDRRGKPLWTLRVGSAGPDGATAIAASGQRTVVVGGFAEGGMFGPYPVSRSTAVVAQIGGGTVEWVLELAATHYTAATDVAFAADGTAVVVGTFSGTLRWGTQKVTADGVSDGFVAAVSADGKPQWLLRLGGTEADTLTSVATSARGTYVGGVIQGQVDLGPTTITTRDESPDGLVARVGRDGVQWAKVLGDKGSDAVADVSASNDAVFAALTVEGSDGSDAAFVTATHDGVIKEIETVGGGSATLVVTAPEPRLVGASGDGWFTKAAGEKVRTIKGRADVADAIWSDGLLLAVGSYLGPGFAGLPPTQESAGFYVTLP